MLPHREGEVLALRYGLFNGEPLSLADVAKILKMSAEGVRKNELQAFRYGPGKPWFFRVTLRVLSKWHSSGGAERALWQVLADCKWYLFAN